MPKNMKENNIILECRIVDVYSNFALDGAIFYCTRHGLMREAHRKLHLFLKSPIQPFNMLSNVQRFRDLAVFNASFRQTLAETTRIKLIVLKNEY
jgi:hypothetical protein